MSEKTSPVEAASAKLLEVITSLLEKAGQGAEHMAQETPQILKELIFQLQLYYGGQALADLVSTLFGLAVAVFSWKVFIKNFDSYHEWEKNNSNSEPVKHVFVGIITGIIFLFSCLVVLVNFFDFVNMLPRVFSPVGHFLSQQLIK